MGGYAIRNLEEIEDSAVRFGLSPQLETHFARARIVEGFWAS